MAAEPRQEDDGEGRNIRRQTCIRCQQTKAIQAFAANGEVGEDLALCRPCRGEVKRERNREKIQAGRGESYTTIVNRAKTLQALREMAAEPVAAPPTPPVPALPQPATIAYPILRRIFERLPKDAQWASDERRRWLNAWTAGLDLEVMVTDDADDD